MIRPEIGFSSTEATIDAKDLIPGAGRRRPWRAGRPRSLDGQARLR